MQAGVKPGVGAGAQVQGGANIQAGASGAAGTIASLKTKLKADFPAITSEADFSTGKLYSVVAQGLRFRMDRNKNVIKTQCMLISKKGGLMRPAFLSAEINTTKKEFTIVNNITGKPFLLIKENDKTKNWDVVNQEAGNNAIGLVKVTQNNLIRSVAYQQGTHEYGKIDFKCPVQKTGICSSAKPSELFNIGVNGKFSTIQLEENPNAEACKNDLEVNSYFVGNTDQNAFAANVVLLHLMARELK